MTVLKLSNGQYKDFTCLQVAYEMKHGKDETSQRIQDAAITAGLWQHNAAAQRDIIYKGTGNWLKLIEKAGL